MALLAVVFMLPNLAPNRAWGLDDEWDDDSTMTSSSGDLSVASLPGPVQGGGAVGSVRITDIRVDEQDGWPTVHLLTTGRVKSTVHYLDHPTRLLLKVRGAQLIRNPAQLPVNLPPLERIRAAQHADGAWVVLDLSHPGPWTVDHQAEGITLSLPEKAGAPKISAEEPVRRQGSTVQHLEPAEPGYQVVDIAVEVQSEKTRLIVTTDAMARYRLERERNGRRLSLTIHGAALAWKGRLSQLPAGALRRVSARAQDIEGEPGVRIEVDLSEAVLYQVFKEQNQVILELENPGVIPQGTAQRGNMRAMISVDLQNAELVSVLRALAQEAGFDMVFTPGVQNLKTTDALVTLTINEQPFYSVLEFILRPRQMAYVLEGNTLRIGLSSEFPTETRVFTLKNVDVKNSNLKETLESALTPGTQGKVVNDEYANRIIVTGIPGDLQRVEEILQDMDVQRRLATRTFPLNYTQADKVLPLVEASLSSLGAIKLNQPENSLVVTDIPGNFNQVARMIRSLDTKSQQIMIEARIVEVALADELDLGVKWDTRKHDPTANPQLQVKSTPLAGKTVGEIVFGTLQSGIDLNATLSLMASKGTVNVISNPRIATLNNQSASLKASQNIPYTTSRVDGGVVTTVIEYLELPITLTVVPQVTKDGQVMLNPMTVIVTTVVNDSTPPATTTRSASTQMMVQDGETIAIGGLVRDEETQRESKVPLLGDIPVLGYLFKSTVAVKNKVELVVFLTPHILE